jgi:hypothetical protein
LRKSSLQAPNDEDLKADAAMPQSSRPRCAKSRLNRTVLRHVIAPSCLVEFAAFTFDMRVSATVRQEREGLCTFYFAVSSGRAWWRS